MIRAARVAQRNCYKQPRVKGFISEVDVRYELKDEKYVIYNLHVGDDKTIQIDHIVINKKGIIVIETKNYSGLIIGNEHARMWVQFINERRHQFFSPIFQNDHHIKMLRQYLKRDHVPYHSIIGFSYNAQLQVDSETQVIHITQLKDAIASLPDAGITEEVQHEIFTTLTNLLT